MGIGCDGSASADCASLWLETRGALLLARLRGGPPAMQARDALELATLGGAACLGRDDIGCLAPGRTGDLVVWPVAGGSDAAGIAFAGALSDPVEALPALRSGSPASHRGSGPLAGKRRDAHRRWRRRDAAPSSQHLCRVVGCCGLRTLTALSRRPRDLPRNIVAE